MAKRGTPHLAIAASAGSGKTYQLTNRYSRLLADGVSPARICALTFSRKAAGEIFDAVIAVLAEAAGAPEAAARLAGRIERNDLDVDRCRALLRQFTATLHRLQIGTLDSFMIGVLRAFPAELGVPPEFDIMDGEGPQAEARRETILSAMFQPGALDSDMRAALLRAFRRATHGEAGKSLDRGVTQVVDDYRRIYRLLPEADRWGAAGCIWGEVPYPRPARDAVVAAEPVIRGALRDQGHPDKVEARWAAFLAAAAEHRAGRPWPRELGYLFEKLAPLTRALETGRASVSMERCNVELDGPVAAAALAVLRHVAGLEIAGAVNRTGGLHTLLALYEQAYDADMRRGGQLSFEDAQYLLTAHNPAGGGRPLSRLAGAPGRLYIDYRLDCRLDHWLLDEFQDTSDLQWEVLGNLVDELIQDAACTRSFFYVGDVKQAIYGWRGGNARLFGAILDRYGDAIARQPLNASFRSGPAVIDTVNSVFGTLDRLSELPDAARREWAAIWGEHQSAPPVAGLSGAAAIIEPVCPDKAKPEPSDCLALTAALIRSMRPLERGLDTAVLVRSNASGKAMVEVLRQACPGLPVVHEGSASIADNPVVGVLLAALTVAAHPGDTLAWGHVGMSPLARTPFFEGRGPGTAARGLLDCVEELGLTETVRRLGAALAMVCPLDAFGRRRLDELLDACTAFEARPARGSEAGGAAACDRAVRELRAHQVQEPAAGGAIRVMTVHQAKGLGFDIVILPDLHGRSLARARQDGLHVARSPDEGRAGEWVLAMPRRDVATCDSVLHREFVQADAAAAFDELCVLYVALTRAKRGLYMVTRYPGDSAATLDAAALVKTQLAGAPKASHGRALTLDGLSARCLYETGQPDWFEALPIRPAAMASVQPTPLPDGYALTSGVRPRLDRLEPSLQDESLIPAAALFDAESRDVLRFGTAIHALFEAVEWSDTADAEAIAAAWRSRVREREDIVRDACEQFLSAMRAPEVAALLRRPTAAAVEVWCERSFEIVMSGQWISGQFDRVVIAYDATGAVTQATVIDFKSNRIQDEAAVLRRKTQAYGPQLRLYRRALARMLGLDERAIRLYLVFTRIGRVMEIA